jgi:hypothetical protein
VQLHSLGQCDTQSNSNVFFNSLRDTNAFSYSNADSNAYPDVNFHADGLCDTHVFSDANVFSDADLHTVIHSFGYAFIIRHTFGDPHVLCDAHVLANSLSDVFPNQHRYDHAHAQRNAYPISTTCVALAVRHIKLLWG